MTTEPHSTAAPLKERSDDDLVRIFADGRESKDGEKRRAAVRAWHVLIARYHPRVAGWVASFTFPDHPDVMVASADREDVVQQAHERCIGALAHSFRGTTGPEFRAALKTCVKYACMDHCRATMRRERGLAGSIDEPGRSDDADGELGSFNRALADLAARVEDGRFGAALDIEAVGRALARLRNEDMRTVIRLSIEGLTSKEIAREIGKSVANVDQLRSRGMRELKGHLGDD